MIDEEYVKVVEQMMVDMADELDGVNGKFTLENGLLSHIHHYGKMPDMDKLQRYVNEKLGQKRYTAICGVYKEVFARDMDEARIFLEAEKPRGTFVKDIQEMY